MSKVLLVTVGGAPQPIITSIQTLHPDRIIFFCSTGSKGSESQIIGAGRPCKIRKNGEIEEIPNLPTHLKLGSRFQANRDIVRIHNPDDATECYRVVSETIQKLLQHNHDIHADYTGGTKTMALALGMAAMDYGIKLYVTTKLGRNLLQPVEEGESTLLVSTAFIDLERKIGQFLPVFLKQYNYPAAIAQLNNLMYSIPLSPETTEQIKKVSQLGECCKAFEAWDRFDHTKALKLLTPFIRSPEIKPCIDFLKRVMQSRADVDKEFTVERIAIPYHGYEVVQDLLLNAERRKQQERYDDAVGRLYRALELLMQIRFCKSYKVSTLDVDLGKFDSLLKNSKERYENMRSPVSGRITLGLRKGYELLSELPGDPLGVLYKAKAKKLAKVLETRNMSLFAHGFRPIGKQNYERFREIVGSFIEEGINTLCSAKIVFEPVQFPNISVARSE